MKTAKSAALTVLLVSLSGSAYADFKYSEQGKMTGGTLMKMTQALGTFSKSMRQANEPQISTTMVKGNRMREERANGEVEIIDLDGRRFIYVDPAKKQYSVMTFDEFKAAMQRAQERAKEQQQAEAAKHPEAQNVKITPKFDAQVTGASRSILGLPANEMKMKMEMEMEVQSTDPNTQPQSGSFVITSDAWMAPSVAGYDEVQELRLKLAKELDWLPSTMSGMAGMKMENPQIGPAMQEFRQHQTTVKGMPLLQTLSIGVAGNGPAPQPGPPASSNAQAQNPSSQQTQTTSIPTSKSGAIGQGLSGIFGGLKKRKQEQQQQQSAQNSSTTAGQGTSASNSLMDMTIEVTSFSSVPLDSALFDIPAGYTQVQSRQTDISEQR